jgi:hypothetical protein
MKEKGMADGKDKADDVKPENTLEPYFLVVVAVKNGDKIRVEGTVPFYSLECACATLNLVAMRDSRIQEAYVLAADKKRVLWGVSPGPIREYLASGGLTPDSVLLGPGGGGPLPPRTGGRGR